MEILQILEDIGLNEGEAKVYLALLKLGQVRVQDLREETTLHRTTIYDFLEKLMNKGLVTYVIQNNVKYYSATHPNKLLDFIREKEGKAEHILPELVKLSDFQKDEVKVEVFKGKEGLKTILNDVLRHGKDYVVFGIDEALFRQIFGDFMEWFFEKERKAGFHERLLTADDVTFTYDSPNVHYRYLPRTSFNPTPTYVWGNNVAILIWEPLTVIKIQHKQVADSYAKYFEILWSIAAKKPKRGSA
jgi:HTH-type transcriptional regulator, sugar sensing transcriptional regulator